MVQYMVSYTSENDGVTIGVIADTSVEAISELVDNFGEGIVPLYENTRAELAALVESLESRPIETKATTDEEEAEQLEVESDEDAPGGVAPDPEGVPSDDGANAVPERDGPAPEADAGSNEGGGSVNVFANHHCNVCGKEITQDRAKATELMLGEPRCTDCST